MWLKNKIDSAAERVRNKLEAVDINALKVSDYNKRYLRDMLRNLDNNLQLRCYSLWYGLNHVTLPLKNISFIDYGGGCGMLTLLAKEIGIGTVIYNDIYEVSCHDAKAIGDALGNTAEHYVNGDLPAVESYLKDHSLKCDLLVSNNVIEHIYDPENFLAGLARLPFDQSLNVFLTTDANFFNPLKHLYIMRFQLEIERKDRQEKWGAKPIDCRNSYFKERYKIIQGHAESLKQRLSSTEIRRLSAATRGKTKPDIEKAADEYWRTKRFPQPLRHPTNTCDPYTGNWTEHLVNPYDFIRMLESKGFKTELAKGYCGRYPGAFKQLIGDILNIFIFSLGKFGICFAPFYGIYGQKTKA